MSNTSQKPSRAYLNKFFRLSVSATSKAILPRSVPYQDMIAVPPDQRVQKTLEAIRNRVPVIYQGELACETTLDGIRVTVVGRPDFLILDGDGYLIRDSKLSRKVDEKHHVEIALQLQLYGWLFEQMVGKPAKRLQVHAGRRRHHRSAATMAESLRLPSLPGSCQ